MARSTAVAGALWLVAISLGLALGWNATAQNETLATTAEREAVRAGVVIALGSRPALSRERRPAQWFASILQRNTVVFLLVLAGVVTGGILTVTTLVYNGVSFGLTLATALAVGLPPGALLPAIAPHAVFESAAFILAGGVGLGGTAIFRGTPGPSGPGRRRGAAALTAAAGWMLLVVGASVEAWISLGAVAGGG